MRRKYEEQSDATRVSKSDPNVYVNEYNPWVQQGDFMVNVGTGQHIMNAIPLRRVYPEFDLVTFGRSLFRKPQSEPLVDLPIDNDSYYRQVLDYFPGKSKNSIISDMRNSGVVRTTPSTSVFKSPMFSKGKVYDGRDGLKNSFVIKSKRNSNLQWEAVDNLGNPIKSSEPQAAFTPLVNGKPNVAGIQNFDVYRYLPEFGKYQKFRMNKPVNLPVTGLNTTYNLSE